MYAIDSLEKRLALNPSDDNIRLLLGNLLYSHAKVLLSEGKAAGGKLYMVDAMKHIDRVVKNSDGGNPLALHIFCEMSLALLYPSESSLRFCNKAGRINHEQISNKHPMKERIEESLLDKITGDIAELLNTGLFI